MNVDVESRPWVEEVKAMLGSRLLLLSRLGLLTGLRDDTQLSREVLGGVVDRLKTGRLIIVLQGVHVVGCNALHSVSLVSLRHRSALATVVGHVGSGLLRGLGRD